MGRCEPPPDMLYTIGIQKMNLNSNVIVKSLGGGYLIRIFLATNPLPIHECAAVSIENPLVPAWGGSQHHKLHLTNQPECCVMETQMKQSYRQNHMLVDAYLLPQTGFLHKVGWVNLNCCSTFSILLPHSTHSKHPYKSSGRTCEND